jgi:hypothetical protein
VFRDLFAASALLCSSWQAKANPAMLKIIIVLRTKTWLLDQRRLRKSNAVDVANALVLHDSHANCADKLPFAPPGKEEADIDGSLCKQESAALLLSGTCARLHVDNYSDPAVLCALSIYIVNRIHYLYNCMTSV